MTKLTKKQREERMKQGKGADWWAPEEDEDELKAVDDVVAQARAALVEAESRKAELQAHGCAACGG